MYVESIQKQTQFVIPGKKHAKYKQLQKGSFVLSLGTCVNILDGITDTLVKSFSS